MNRTLAQVIVQNYDGIQHTNKGEVKEAYRLLNIKHPEYNPTPIPWNIWHKTD